MGIKPTMKKPITVLKFKTIQKRLGLTNKAMAQALKVEENTVNRWRLGIHPIPAWVPDRLNCLEYHEH